MRSYVSRREKYANSDVKYAGVTVERNIRYGERKSQTFSLYRSSEKRAPIFIYFHGGALVGRTKKWRRGFCVDVAKLGFAVLNVEYKGEVTLGAKECLEEVEKLLPFLVEQGSSLALDLDKLFIGGDEIGAYIASYLAIKAEKYGLRPYGVTLFSGFYDAVSHAKSNSYYSTQYHFIKKFFKVDLKLAQGNRAISDQLNELSVSRMVESDFPPVFICHSVNDEFLPEQGEIMVKALKQKGVSVWEFWAISETRYHNFHLNRRSKENQSVMEYLSTFLAEALGGGIYRNEHREI